MKRYGLLILIAVAGCSPQFDSGKTQCSDNKECPSGYSCKDDGTSALHYCFDNKAVGCPAGSGFYCSQSNTCWSKPGACSTVAYCGTTKYPGSAICATSKYHVDCNAGACQPNSATGAGGSGGATGKGGAIGTGGYVGSGGVTGKGGAIGTGGYVGSGGVTGRGGVTGTGGGFGSGGATGKGGVTGTGGTTATLLCSGTAYSCSVNTDQTNCLYENGCTWNSSTATCSGTPSSCLTYPSSTACIYNGCSWAGALTCNATPVTSACSSATAPTDAGAPTACTLCTLGSCCGQLTSCVNDTTCKTQSSGPLWIAYLDCAVNCCYTACGF